MAYKTQGGVRVEIIQRGCDCWCWRCACGSGDTLCGLDARADARYYANRHARECYRTEY